MGTETTNQLREMNYEIAEAIAPTWERRREEIEQVSAPLREWMIRELAPKAGETVLELAAGVGDTGFEAAAIVGERGRVISTDISPAMLDAARRRGAELGLANVEYREINAERIELEDDSVDGVLCRFGYMLMEDPGAALAETRRVLRPSGRLSLAVWGSAERNPFFTAAVIPLVQRGHVPPPDPSGPGIFSLGVPERVRTLLADAGFDGIRIEEVPTRFEIADTDEYLSLVADTAGPIALVLRELPDEEREAVRTHAEAALETFAGPDGYKLPALAVCAVAG